MTRSPSTLDLTELAAAPMKVRLPARWPRGWDWLRRLLRRPPWRLYDMASPQLFGAFELQRFASLMQRAEAISQDDPGEDDVAEAVSLLTDACQLIVPGAPREVIERLGVARQKRLTEAFRDASPALSSAADRRAEANGAGRAARRTSAS